MEVLVIAPVVECDEIGQQLIARQLFANADGERHRRIGLDRTDAVNARHRRDDDDVVTFKQRARCGMAHAVDLFVDRRFFLDVGVGARYVGFGLVVVVIGDEIFDGVVREEAFEFSIELRGQRLVRRQDQRRALCRLDDVRHRERFAGTRDAEQHLVLLVLSHAFDEFCDRLRLVALRRILRDDLEFDAAFALLGTLGPVRYECRCRAGHDGMCRHQRLTRQHLPGALGTLFRLCQQRSQAVGQAFAAHRRTGAGLAQSRKRR